MTRVVVKYSDKTSVCSFCTSGHSGYAAEGNDIVCAAISSATEFAVNILEKFCVDLDIKVDEKKASVCCFIVQSSVNEEKRDVIHNVIEVYSGFIKELQENYPEYVELSTEV